MGSMPSLPSLRVCFDLLVLRRRLPRMLEEEPLDAILARLEAWRPSRRSGPARTPSTRRALDESIRATEALITRLHLATDTCLYRSMGRFALLRSHGVPAVFCMGVKPPPNSVDGHAWVEDESGPYGEEIEDGRYVITFWHPHEDAQQREP